MMYSSMITNIINKYITFIAGGGVAFGVAVSMLPEILFVSNFKDRTKYLEKDGSEKKIDPATQALIDKAITEINMNPIEEASLDFYVSSLGDPVHYGSTKLRTGAYVGLPVSLQYDKDTDLSKESLSFSGVRLVFDDTSNSQASQDLAEAILLSQKGKEFLIAREIHYARSYRLHIDTIIKTVAGSGVILSWNYIYNRMAFMRMMKPLAKVFSFVGVSVIWTCLYLLLKDTHRCWVDYAVDKKTAKMGKSYAEGGVEFYRSVLKRNKAMRALTRDGKRWFTPFGNDISTFRQKTIQKTSRRDNLIRILKTYEQEENKNAAEDIKAVTENQAA